MSSSHASNPRAAGRFDASQGPRVVGPGDGKLVEFGLMGARFMVDGGESGGDFALVEHPLQPRSLAAPLHRHSNEDEYSYILEGRLGAQLGDDVVYGEPGDLIFKPRGQWHTFWNADDTPCRILEIISPAGFEQYFAEVVADLQATGGQSVPAIAARYSLEVDFSTVPRLCQEHGLNFPM
jgi:quercetin dioxygenase-like cupin family protein